VSGEKAAHRGARRKDGEFAGVKDRGRLVRTRQGGRIGERRHNEERRGR